MTSDYAQFFRGITGHAPYPYQERLGQEGWPDLVDVPTGLGKTAAVVAAWLGARLDGRPDTPRRLVYCLPMRVLVEQTRHAAEKWIEAAGPAFDERGLARPSVHLLMGGETDAPWSLEPANPAIIVGTQDMLLSRALMRGYGMSRYAWPIHFALLHGDALWVLDEVQLMGPALATSTQLEAFRRAFAVPGPSRTIWMSATIERSWLATADFRNAIDDLTALTLGTEDRAKAARLLRAEKRLHRAPVALDRDTARGRWAGYMDALADAVLDAHREGRQTLVILNRVDRAQGLFRALQDRDGSPTVLLLHARFRPPDRRRIERALRGTVPEGGRIVVATQAVEAGVDISSATLFTELAPWPSLVQRFGRCNRYGEVEGGADVFWIPIDVEPEPYEAGALTEARGILEGLDAVGLEALPSVSAHRRPGPVLRRRDFLSLFDTEPDLSGFDLDVSRYIRDDGAPQVQVFWRDVDDAPDDDKGPAPDELCAASMAAFGRYRKKKVRKRSRTIWVWDGLARRWAAGSGRARPGAVYLLAADLGGYDPDVGFDPEGTDSVAVVHRTEDREPDSVGADPSTSAGHFVTLEAHTRRVESHARRLCVELGMENGEVESLGRAARWHDLGKAHPAFQRALLDYLADGGKESDGHDRDTIWAKSSGEGRLDYRVGDGDQAQRRPHFRHELASMLAWLAHGGDDRGDADLVAYLIAAHHGKLRLALRALPQEPSAPGGTRYARGVWEGDELPAVAFADGFSVPATPLDLDLMEMGWGPHGPSWTERTLGLLDRLGPFRLAWLEAVLRIADQKASVEEREAKP